MTPTASGGYSNEQGPRKPLNEMYLSEGDTLPVEPNDETVRETMVAAHCPLPVARKEREVNSDGVISDQ